MSEASWIRKNAEKVVKIGHLRNQKVVAAGPFNEKNTGRNLISIHSPQKVFHENKMLKNVDLKYSERRIEGTDERRLLINYIVRIS